MNKTWEFICDAVAAFIGCLFAILFSWKLGISLFKRVKNYFVLRGNLDDSQEYKITPLNKKKSDEK